MTSSKDLPYSLKIVYASSETKGHSCVNLLNEVPDAIWMSDDVAPQEVVLQITYNTATEPDVSTDPLICVVGWSCYKNFSNNPKNVEISVAKQFEGTASRVGNYASAFTPWAALLAKESSGTHLFSVKPIPKEYTFIKFKIMETFAGKSKVFASRLILLQKRPDFSTPPKEPKPQPRRPVLSPNPGMLASGVQPSRLATSSSAHYYGGASQAPQPAVPPQRSDEAARNMYRPQQEEMSTKHPEELTTSALPPSTPSKVLPAPITHHVTPTKQPDLLLSDMSPSYIDSRRHKSPSRGTFDNQVLMEKMKSLEEEASILMQSRPQARFRESPAVSAPAFVGGDVVANTLEDLSELHRKLSEMSDEITHFVETRSPQKPERRTEENTAATAPSSANSNQSQVAANTAMRFVEDLEGGLNFQVTKLRDIEKGMRECVSRFKDVEVHVGHLAERVAILEESNILPLVEDHKNLAFELRKEFEQFKAVVQEKYDHKLKKVQARFEAKLNEQVKEVQKQMDQTLSEQTRLIHETLLQSLTQTFSQKIDKSLAEIRLVHPDNLAIQEYNKKVRFLNKKSIAANNSRESMASYQGSVKAGQEMEHLEQNEEQLQRQMKMPMFYQLQKSLPTIGHKPQEVDPRPFAQHSHSHSHSHTHNISAATGGEATTQFSHLPDNTSVVAPLTSPYITLTTTSTTKKVTKPPAPAPTTSRFDKILQYAVGPEEFSTTHDEPTKSLGVQLNAQTIEQLKRNLEEKSKTLDILHETLKNIKYSN